MEKNPYLPYAAHIEEAWIENDARDIKSFRVVFDD